MEENSLLFQYYYGTILPELIRIKLYEPLSRETNLIVGMVRDAMENLLDNHPLYRLESLNFLKNFEGRLDFWLEIVHNNIKVKIRELASDFIYFYEKDEQL